MGSTLPNGYRYSQGTFFARLRVVSPAGALARGMAFPNKFGWHTIWLRVPHSERRYEFVLQARRRIRGRGLMV